MENLNPFNLFIKFVFVLYKIYGFTLTTIFTIWLWVCSGLIVWIVIALFLPEISFIEHITWLANIVIVNPAHIAFEFLTDIAETLRVEYLIPETNPIKQCFYVIGWLFFILASLIVMPAIWFGWVVFCYFGFSRLLSGEALALFMGGSNAIARTKPSGNIGHLLMGRVSYEDVYKADVQANSIVEAFERRGK